MSISLSDKPRSMMVVAFDQQNPTAVVAWISPLSVGEQLLYEIGGPWQLSTADVICDSRRFRSASTSKNVVEVTGARGRAPRRQYKVAATWQDVSSHGQVA